MKMNDLIQNRKALEALAVSLFLLLAILTAVPVSANPGAVTRDYGNITMYNWGKGNFADVWDLTKGDLTLSYVLDMSKITTAGWAATEVGIRQVGAGNIDPNLMGGWMQSNYISGISNPNSRNNNDMHLLSKHGWLFQQYDAKDANTLVTPYWSGNNHGFWFDRDGVDQWQAGFWGASGTYDTGGIYTIVVTFHAINSTTATMFATINGVQQGLYMGGWKNAEPEFYPAGRSFTNDMTKMQVFYGRGGGGGSVTASGITVTGCLAQYPLTISASPIGGGTTNPAPGTNSYEWGSSVTVNAIPASGYVLDYWSLDTANAGSSNPITVTMTAPHSLEARFIGPQTIKQRVLQDLTTLSETVADKKDGKKLDEAIKHLTKSLDPELWISETRLNPKQGEKVFSEEKDAVVKLVELIKDKKSAFFESATLQGFVDRLVSADRLLASGAINDAAGGDVKKIAQANDELGKGDARVADNHFTDAIEHYRNAWEHAMKAV
jgi:hypothetical protein